MRGDEEFIRGDVLPHILKYICKAAVVIANIDGRNANVFYELGIAHAMDKSTLLVSKTVEDFPIDVQSKKIIIYKHLRELSSLLKDELLRLAYIQRNKPNICEAMKGRDISLSHKFPYQNHQYNLVSASENKFEKVKNIMPELITEFKTDLSTEENKLIREFFVLPNKKVCLGGSEKPRFIYYEEKHKGLRNKIDILENQGFLINVTLGNAPIYRMTEEFVELIIKYG
jgi:hypothetical protein